jgi:hypothetical protein
MRDIAKAILGAGESDGDDDENSASGSLLGKLDLKTLLGKKGKGKTVREKAEAA